MVSGLRDRSVLVKWEKFITASEKLAENVVSLLRRRFSGRRLSRSWKHIEV